MTPQRQRPTEPHERNRVHDDDPYFLHARGIARLTADGPAWMATASRSVAQDLRAFAAKYPHRFAYRDGKLVKRR